MAGVPSSSATPRAIPRAIFSRGWRAVDLHRMNRFLIVRLGALGDIVHAIPVAAALRHAFPGSRIDWLVAAKHRAILDLVPIIDRRLAINDRASGSADDEPRGRRRP